MIGEDHEMGKHRSIEEHEGRDRRFYTAVLFVVYVAVAAAVVGGLALLMGVA